MYSMETLSTFPSRLRTAELRDMSMSSVPARGSSGAARRGMFGGDDSDGGGGGTQKAKEASTLRRCMFI